MPTSFFRGVIKDSSNQYSGLKHHPNSFSSQSALMNLSPSPSHLNVEWYKGIGPGFSVATLLITIVVPVLLTRALAYIRRRNSVIRNLQGPPPSSFIFGWSLHTFAPFTGLIHCHRERSGNHTSERSRRLEVQMRAPVWRRLVSEWMSRREYL